MEKSRLEELDDKTLIYICQEIINECYEENYGEVADVFEYESITDIYESNLKMIGLKNIEAIDLDFILNLIKLNIENLVQEGFDGTLKRPTVGKYFIDAKVSETAFQNVFYRHKVNSYSEDTVREVVNYEEQQGIKSVWEGNHIQTDVYDTETNEIHWGRPYKDE
jgi:hypothetical protein